MEERCYLDRRGGWTAGLRVRNKGGDGRQDLPGQGSGDGLVGKQVGDEDNLVPGEESLRFV